MKKLLLLLLCVPMIGVGQFSVGNDQTICLGDSSLVITTLSGPATSGCSGVTDSLTCPNAGKMDLRVIFLISLILLLVLLQLLDFLKEEHIQQQL